MFELLSVIMMLVGGMILLSTVFEVISRIFESLARYFAEIISAVTLGVVKVQLTKDREQQQQQPPQQNNNQQQQKRNPQPQQQQRNPPQQQQQQRHQHQVAPKVFTGIAPLDKFGQKLTDEVNRKISEMDKKEKR